MNIPPDLEASFREFVAEVETRLETGHREYGSSSLVAKPVTLLREIEQELLDTMGWTWLLWRRMRELRGLVEKAKGDDAADIAAAKAALAEPGFTPWEEFKAKRSISAKGNEPTRPLYRCSSPNCPGKPFPVSEIAHGGECVGSVKGNEPEFPRECGHARTDCVECRWRSGFPMEVFASGSTKGNEP